MDFDCESQDYLRIHLTQISFTESVRSYYNLVIKKAGQFLTVLQVNLLKFALSLRSYSPAVHASQQVGPEILLQLTSL